MGKGKRGLVLTWQDVLEDPQWRGEEKAILIGNGASRNVWENFAYDSLFEIAHNTEHPLTDRDDQIFEELDTKDFEQVLRALRHAWIVNNALKIDVERVLERYRAIQRALVEAIAKVHVAWDQVPPDKLGAIRTEIVNYRYVFSTNYDLLLYWAILAKDPNPGDVKDFFWNRWEQDGEAWLVFNPSDTSIESSDVTRILYLHGGLHIYRLPNGLTAKYVASEDENLLAAFRRFLTNDEPFGPIPLFVTEGTSADKRVTIASSEYLTFAYQTLVNCDLPLVIFGHSLSDNDAHIAEAIMANPKRPIAISVLPRSLEEINYKKGHYRKILSKVKNLYFFDATTHPLGNPNLRVDSTPGGI